MMIEQKYQDLKSQIAKAKSVPNFRAAKKIELV